MQPTEPRSNEEEVLLAYSVEPMHDRATLERYLSKYPDHASALVDCTLELMMLPAEISPVWVAESAVEAGWKKFQASLAAVEGAVENPFARLSPMAFKKLAARLEINNLLLLRIRDRAIRAASMPRAFVRRLAAELGMSVNKVMEYLEGPPNLATASSFRSATKPAAPAQIEFKDAVKSSQLTNEQQKTLLAMED